MQHRRSTFGRRAFFCGRPGGLELVTRLPARSVTFLLQFRRNLKTFLFSFYYRTERTRGFKFMRYITLLLSLTLTLALRKFWSSVNLRRRRGRTTTDLGDATTSTTRNSRRTRWRRQSTGRRRQTSPSVDESRHVRYSATADRCNSRQRTTSAQLSFDHYPLQFSDSSVVKVISVFVLVSFQINHFYFIY